MKKTIVLITFAFCSLYSFLALAQEEVAKQPAVARLLDTIVEIAAYALAAVGSILVLRLVHAFEKKTKIDVPDAWEKELTNLIPKAVAYAEEQGHKLVLKKAKALEMNEKLELASGFVLDLANTKKVKQMGKDKIAKLVESHLSSKRSKPTG